MHARSGNGHSGNKEVKDQDKIKEPASATIEVDSPASEVLPEVLRQAYKDATSSLVEDDSALSEVVHEALSGGLETPKDAASSLNKVGSLANFTSEDLPESFKITKSFSAEDGATTSAATPDALLEGLAKVMAGMTLRDEPADKKVDRATQLVQAYCFQHEPQFQRAMVYRDRGWNHNKDKGDAHFKGQREQADKADDHGEKIFYAMMVRIAEGMHAATGALNPTVPAGRKMKVLDVCMAPGGYSAAVLKIHPEAEVFGLTLPKADGGHAMMLPLDRLRGIKYSDVTMLVTEMLKGTDKTIPEAYPDHGKLNTLRPFISHKMDLVFLDGIVLRTHERASYRQRNEPLRLSAAQMVLGMQRITHGGTMVMLLHKVDSWASLSVLYTFSKFSKVTLFKPTTAHATRSSFYIVAQDVDTESPSAIAAVAEWKNQWYAATFGGPEGTGEKVEPEESFVLEVLKTFGQKLLEMGAPIWRIQADALSKTAYAGDVDATPTVAEKREV